MFFIFGKEKQMSNIFSESFLLQKEKKIKILQKEN